MNWEFNQCDECEGLNVEGRITKVDQIDGGTRSTVLYLCRDCGITFEDWIDEPCEECRTK